MKYKYQQKLQKRKEAGSLRSLSLFTGFADFFSNDYLGLAQNNHPECFGTGSTGSRLLSGNTEEAMETEDFLADFFGAEAALIFNSGYDANVGLFASIPQRGDTVLYDELIHASVRDGIRLSHAKAYAFRHNDAADLERKIQKAEGAVFVAVESVYSMDGDLAPLEEMAEICLKYEALLIVDEAHAGGIRGSEGRGLSEELHLTDKIFARVFTFGKAYGTHGAAVLASEEIKDYLVNFARSFIYTTALPAFQYTMIRSQIQKSREDYDRIRLQENIAYFRSVLKENISLSDDRSPIQVILVPGVQQAVSLAEKLQAHRLAVKAILSPTVPVGQERLRICLHAYNTKGEIDLLAKIIRENFCLV